MSAAGAGPVIIAAGGTGGHVFPAEALARSLRARGLDSALVTDRRGAALSADLAEVACYRVRASAVVKRGLWGLVSGAINLLLGMIQARALFRRLAPRAAVGFGGYASLPSMLVATRIGLPTVIHEANAVLGRANRLLAPRASAIATSFRITAGLAPRHRPKVSQIGNPVRPAIAQLRNVPCPRLAATSPIELLVVGGSQGAKVMSDVVPAALARLDGPLKGRLRVTQQCRAEDLAAAKACYARAAIDARLAPFIDDMAGALAVAHLVICRAGASTVAELAAAGRPAVLVPYPHAADDHQAANARALVEGGGGWMIAEAELTAERLAQMLAALLAAPEQLHRAAAAAREMARPDAAERLADLTGRLIAEAGAAGGAP